MLDVKCIARLAFKKSQVGVILGEIYIHTCRQNVVYTSVFCMSNHKKKRMTSPSLLDIHVVTWKNQEQPNVRQKTRRQGCCRVHNSEWNMSTLITMMRWFRIGFSVGKSPLEVVQKKKNMDQGWIFAYRSEIVSRIQIYNFFKRFHCQKKMAQLFLLNDKNMQMR